MHIRALQLVRNVTILSILNCLAIKQFRSINLVVDTVVIFIPSALYTLQYLRLGILLLFQCVV